MNDYNKLVAHYDDKREQEDQLLKDHLFSVAEIAKGNGDTIGIGSMCELIGLLHDIGKSSSLFQLYIKGEYRGRVNHSSAGAKILDIIELKIRVEYDIDILLRDKGLKLGVWNLYREVLQYPILAHHGLYDIIDHNFDYRTAIRLDLAGEKDEDYFAEALGFFEFLQGEYKSLKGKSIYDIYYHGFMEFVGILNKLDKIVSEQEGQGKDKRIKRNKARYFYYGAFVRLLLSILKDADIYDSANYYRPQKDRVYNNEEVDVIWNKMSDNIECLYRVFNDKPDKSELDITRTALANEIHEFSKNHENGAYKLSMPVGSGKTYAALRYSIENAKRFQRSRIFYCTAFLSVLEQNAASIKGVIGNDYVLEHHSNIVENFETDGDQEDENEYRVNEYLKESWESPVILTTIVQLSNTMFQGRSSNIRRFSKLINSVIIIDEIQSLPAKTIYNFNLMTNFLVNIMGCSILHCTATQPNFDDRTSLDYPCFYGGESIEPFIISSIKSPEVFERVDYYSLLGDNLDQVLVTYELVEHIKDQMAGDMSALIVLNTKKGVLNLYESLLADHRIQEEDWEVIYLTTNQCPKHRLDIINDMKVRLKSLRNGSDGRKLICVSTKLVEAGVDIDFDIVYRSLTGIDSIIQCGGRCNREGEKSEKGRLFIFEYGDESLRYLPDLAKQRRAAKTALRSLIGEGVKDGKIDIERACNHYFSKLYLNEGEEGRQLEFPMGEGDTILDLLTTNPRGRSSYKVKHGEKPDFSLKQSFKTAATNFELIKENTINVIVQYENSEVIEELYAAIDEEDYQRVKCLLKLLQPYTVGIRRIEGYESYIAMELDGMALILNQDAYDEKVGIIKGELQSLVF